MFGQQEIGRGATGQPGFQAQSVLHSPGVFLENFPRRGPHRQFPQPGAAGAPGHPEQLGAAIGAPVAGEAGEPVGAMKHDVSTLLTMVGLPQAPAICGNGGLARGLARRPSSALIRAVSSPQM